MSVDSVLIPADKPASGTGSSTEPRYSLLLSTDATLIESAQRLRYDVFSNEPGFALTGPDAGLDVDRFDEHCDHLLVREDNSGELVVTACCRRPVLSRPEGFIPQQNSTSQRWMRCGRRWWRWDARSFATIIATA